MDYTEANIPCDIAHGETMVLGDGQTIRFESNGEAKDVFLSDGFSPTTQLFPENSYEFSAGGKTIKLTALFTDGLHVEFV